MVAVLVPRNARRTVAAVVCALGYAAALGLAIALGLAEANGCRLSVDATPGGGSRFVLALPVPAGKRRA